MAIDSHNQYEYDCHKEIRDHEHCNAGKEVSDEERSALHRQRMDETHMSRLIEITPHDDRNDQCIDSGYHRQCIESKSKTICVTAKVANNDIPSHESKEQSDREEAADEGSKAPYRPVSKESVFEDSPVKE
jgi:hypothetical protein